MYAISKHRLEATTSELLITGKQRYRVQVETADEVVFLTGDAWGISLVSHSSANEATCLTNQRGESFYE